MTVSFKWKYLKFYYINWLPDIHLPILKILTFDMIVKKAYIDKCSYIEAVKFNHQKYCILKLKIPSKYKTL